MAGRNRSAGLYLPAEYVGATEPNGISGGGRGGCTRISQYNP